MPSSETDCSHRSSFPALEPPRSVSAGEGVDTILSIRTNCFSSLPEEDRKVRWSSYNEADIQGTTSDSPHPREGREPGSKGRWQRNRSGFRWQEAHF